jgi:hypothetical protein
MMKKLIWIVCVFLCSVIAASVAGAGDFDGTRPLLISVIRVVECTPDAACREVTPASVELPQFLKIDFANKTIGPAAADDETPVTAIERREVVDGKLILQGAEDGYEKIHDGLGWTIAISEESGQVVLTASGDQVAFVVFGASLPL